MRSVVSYDLHSRLLQSFPDCYYSMQQLRVSYPSLDGTRFYFLINFDKFAGPRLPRPAEARFGLCVPTLDEYEEMNRVYKQIVYNSIKEMK